MSTYDDLRAALTRYKQDQSNMVADVEYQAIIDFISWLEAQL